MISRELPSLRQLRTFEAVSRLESVSAAAREVNLSQPGIAQAIHALEQRVNARLFEFPNPRCTARLVTSNGKYGETCIAARSTV
jgi:molybdenum-dependent DNA-binding transcriptional regulator ModE